MSDTPRVMVVVSTTDEAMALLGWADHFARARQTDLVVVCPPGSASTSRTDDDASTPKALKAAIGEALPADREVPTIEHVEGASPLSAVLDAVTRHAPSLLIVGASRSALSRNAGALAKDLMDQAPCEVMLLRAEAGSAATAGKSLVPIAGGPHATVALGLAHAMAEDLDGEVTALRVESEEAAGDDMEMLGKKELLSTLSKAGFSPSERLDTRVVISADVTQGIADVTHEGYDLVLLGASNIGFVSRVLFSTVPEKLMRGPGATTVAVVRAAHPLVTRARFYLSDLALRWVPQLTREQRVELFQQLRVGSVLNFNYVALITLSSAIAALGLIQDSPAVVIGAMLVAPLMTPMIGAGLALVQGNAVLIRRATTSIVVGFLLALLTGFFFGLVAPLDTLTHELLARGAPNLLDLLIALFSGAAGAFALAQPGLSGALPGVAIAAALVPPIATAGISLATGDAKNALGAATLFGTNLVTIILSSTFTLYALGIRHGHRQGKIRIWVRRSLQALFLAAVIMALPLGASLFSRIPITRGPLRTTLRQVVTQAHDDLAWISLDETEEGKRVTVAVYADKPAADPLVQRIEAAVKTKLGSKVTVRVVTLLTHRTKKRGERE